MAENNFVKVEECDSSMTQINAALETLCIENRKDAESAKRDLKEKLSEIQSTEKIISVVQGSIDSAKVVIERNKGAGAFVDVMNQFILRGETTKTSLNIKLASQKDAARAIRDRLNGHIDQHSEISS